MGALESRSVDLWRQAQFNRDHVRIASLSIAGCLGNSREQGVDAVSMLLWALAIIAGAFVAYNLFHYALFLLATHPKDAGDIGHVLNEFEKRQLVEWVPKPDDFLKHDDENRTYDDVFGPYRGELDNYSTCVFPRAIFTHPYEADCALLAPADGMRLLELGCGSGAAADYLVSQRKVEITCVTNSAVQADICRRKFEKCGGRVSVMLTDFDRLDLPDNSFDAIYAFESMALQFSRRQPSGVQAAPARLQADPLSPFAILGLGPDAQLHPAPAVVEVQAEDANHGGHGKDHLAHIESVCLRQRIQHRARHQAARSDAENVRSCRGGSPTSC